VGAVVAGASFGEIPDEWECQREASGISPTARINDDPAQSVLHLSAVTPILV
jgi:hypothetical protein